MKKFLKILAFSLLAILVFILAAVFLNYHNDIPLETLKQKYTYPDSKFVKVQGMDVHYRVVGPSDSFIETLVLMHGTGASLHTWEGWVETLKDDFQVVVLDMPAFGLTGPHPERDYSMNAYVGFLDAFADKLGLKMFHLGGNSMGGRIAWEYMLKHAERVGKLILVDASGYPQEKEMPLGFRLAKNETTANWLLKITPRSLHRKSLEEVYVKKEMVTEELVDRYFELMLRPGNRQAFVDRVNTPYESAEGKMHQFLNSTLIIWGDQDLWVNPKDADRFDKEIINSRLAMIKDAGHVPMEEYPEETARIVLDFLKEPFVIEQTVEELLTK